MHEFQIFLHQNKLIFNSIFHEKKIFLKVQHLKDSQKERVIALDLAKWGTGEAHGGVPAQEGRTVG